MVCLDKLSVRAMQSSSRHDLGRECGDHRSQADLETRVAQFSKFFDLQNQSVITSQLFFQAKPNLFSGVTGAKEPNEIDKI